MRCYSVYFVALTICLTAPSKIYAQSTPLDALWIRAFCTGATIDGLYCKTDGEYQELMLDPFRPRPPFAIPYINGTLPLYTKVINPETGKEQYVVSATVRIPPSSRQVTVVVVSKGVVDGIRRFDTKVYDDSADVFPLDSVRLINLSPFEVAARFGNEAFKTAPGEYSVQPVEVDEKSRVFAVAGQLSSTSDGYHLKKFYQGPITVPPGRRLTMLTVYSVEAMQAHGYDVMTNADGKDQPEYIVVKWLDRPTRSSK